MWESKYGVFSAKFIIHKAGEAAGITNYPFYPWVFNFVIFKKGAKL
jgi:hypothetical protein